MVRLSSILEKSYLGAVPPKKIRNTTRINWNSLIKSQCVRNAPKSNFFPLGENHHCSTKDAGPRTIICSALAAASLFPRFGSSCSHPYGPVVHYSPSWHTLFCTLDRIYRPWTCNRIRSPSATTRNDIQEVYPRKPLPNAHLSCFPFCFLHRSLLLRNYTGRWLPR